MPSTRSSSPSAPCSAASRTSARRSSARSRRHGWNARRSGGRRTIVFVDEVHRFNKSQQDAFLPHVESGLFTFIGATTENPSFEVNSALLSRATVHVLQPLAEADLQQIVAKAAGIDAVPAIERAALRSPDRLRRRRRAAPAQRATRTWRRRRPGEAQARSTTRLLEGRWASAAPLRQGRRAVLRHHLGAAQVGARLRPRRLAVLVRAHARRRRRPALRGAPPGAHGQRGHRPGRPARAAPGAGCRRGLRAARHARGRTGAGRVRGLPGHGAQVQRGLHRLQRGAAPSSSRTARGRCRCTCATRRPS